MTLALLESAFEQKLIECAVTTFVRSVRSQDSDIPKELLAADPRVRMQQSMRAAHGSGGELMTWVYCALLVLLGVVLNAVVGHAVKG